MDKNHVPALMLTLVTRDSVIFAGGLGTAQLADNRPNDALQLFRMGSVSKSFTTLCLLRLVREGKLNLDDKLADIAPEVPVANRWEKNRPVRVVHLLEHTAGFDDMHFHALYNRTDKDPTAMEMVMAHKKSLKCRWEPGTRMAYSNPGYVVAGYLIEKFSGKTFEEYVKETVFNPLGMTSSNFRSFREDTTKYAQGYSWADSSYSYVPFYPIMGIAAGALNSNADDMSRLLLMFLNGGIYQGKEMLSVAELNRMEQPATTEAARAGLKAGYGLANYWSKFEYSPTPFHGHNGGIDGFISSYAYNRELGVGYAMSVNSSSGVQEFERMVVEYLTQGKKAQEPEIKPLWSEMVKPFLGFYLPASPRNQFLSGFNSLFQGMNLRQKGDTLFLVSLFQDHDTLLHAGELQFFKPRQSSPSFILIARDGKSPVLSDQGGMLEKSSVVEYWLKLVLLGLSGLVSLSFLLVGLVFLILAIFKRYPSNAAPLTLLAWLSPLMLVISVVFFATALQDFYHLGTKNVNTVGLFISSLLFGMGALITMALSIYKFRRLESRTLAGYLVVVGFSLSFIMVFLMQEGMIGIRMWAY